MDNKIDRIKESIDFMISLGTSPKYVFENLEGLYPGLSLKEYETLRRYIKEKYGEKIIYEEETQIININPEEIFNNALVLLQSADIEEYKEIKKKLLDLLYYIGWDSNLPEDVKKTARKLYHILLAFFE